MKKQIAAAIVTAQAFILLASPSLAQQTQNKVTPTDRQYLTQDAEGSAYEFQLAQLGVQKVSDSATQQYALRLLNDHAKFNTQLMQLAHNKGLTLPVDVNAQDKTKIGRLMQLHGAAFDKAFAREIQDKQQ